MITETTPEPNCGICQSKPTNPGIGRCNLCDDHDLFRPMELPPCGEPLGVCAGGGVQEMKKEGILYKQKFNKCLFCLNKCNEYFMNCQRQRPIIFIGGR